MMQRVAVMAVFLFGVLVDASAQEDASDRAACQAEVKSLSGSTRLNSYIECMKNRERERIKVESQRAAEALAKTREQAETAAAQRSAESAELARQARERHAAEQSVFTKEAVIAGPDKELQATCGRDYGRVALGMSIKRVEECYGDAVPYLIGTVQSASGTTAVFRLLRMQLHVDRRGAIVAIVR